MAKIRRIFADKCRYIENVKKPEPKFVKQILASIQNKREKNTRGMKMLKVLKDNQYKIRVLMLVILDIVAINVCSLLALLVRYDFKYLSIPTEYIVNALKYAPINTVIVLILLGIFRLYRSVWTYASVTEFFYIIGVTTSNLVIQFVMYSFVLRYSMPLAYYPLYAVLFMIAMIGLRFGYRFLRMMRRTSDKSATNVMIIGAGEAGTHLIKEIKASTHLNKVVKCFVDDNANKKGRYLLGVEICGNRYDIPELVEKYDIHEIYVAIPSAPKSVQTEIINICSDTGRKVKMLPGIYQLVNGDVSVSKLRDVQIEDLLGRDTVKVDMSEIGATIEGKTILVTGGGGSIGSELCRQIATYNPKQLIIFDIYENNAYEIQQELKRKYGDKLNLEVLIGSVRNTHRVESIFEKYSPQIVFHAAAHKHVPLMEDSPCEAIKNNVFGTYKVAQAAGKYGVERFVLISTDKAVNPTNIMGASKRMCEMIVQYMDTLYNTEYVAVRFGNVLGSNGSVIPLFKKQIEAGGPVTVTHKDIVRYFMTIPEAVSLVLQAETYAKGGEIFVLDMGKPVKIDKLARNLIKLSGYEPDVDIKIEYTGLRPGEKLYEELLMDEEGLKETANSMIHIGKPIEMDYTKFAADLEDLKVACQLDDVNIKRAVAKVVETYKANE